MSNTWTKKLPLSFDTATSRRRSLRGYSSVIAAGLERTGWTQAELAEEAGVCEATISRHLQSGMANGPTSRTLSLILGALDWELVAAPKAAAARKRKAS